MHYPIIHQVSFSRSFSEAIDTLYDPYFHFCCELALETWAKGFYNKPLGVHDLCHAHSLASLQRSGLVNASPDWKLSTVPEMEPLQR